MTKKHLFWGSIICAMAVAIGAFGAHAWKDYLTEMNRLDTFETAAKYQMYGGFSLILLGIIEKQQPHKLFNLVGYFFLAACLIFPGSLYLICLTQQKIFGAIAPIGGLSFILGFILLAKSSLK